MEFLLDTMLHLLLMQLELKQKKIAEANIFDILNIGVNCLKTTSVLELMKEHKFRE